jgi:hypothetical protein
MRKIGYLVCLLFVVLCSASSYASGVGPGIIIDPEGGDVSDHLLFKLSNDTAMISGTTGDVVKETATDTFYVQFDDPFYPGASIASMKAELAFDNTKLEFVEALKMNWGANFQVTTTVSSTTTKILLQYWGSQASPTSYTPFAIIKFRPRCQAELAINDVIFTQLNATNEVNLLPSGAQLTPCLTCYDDGFVQVGDYAAKYLLVDSTRSNAVGAKFGMPVWAKTNFQTGQMINSFSYDEDALRFDSVHMVAAYVSKQPPDVSGNDLVVIDVTFGGNPASIFDSVVIYDLWFTVLCNPPHQNTLTPISWIPGSCVPGGPTGCATTGMTYEYVNGSLQQLDSSALFANSTQQEVGMSSATLLYPVQMSNSFPAGMPSGAQTGDGIVVNFNPGSPGLALVGLQAGSMGGLNYEWSNCSEGAQVKQRNQGLLFRDSTTAPTQLFTTVLSWSPMLYTASWASRIIQPEFTASIGAGYLTSKVPDNVGCITAVPNASGQIVPLQFDPMTPVKVRMAEFATFGHGSSTACTWFDLKVRGTCPVDSFTMILTVPSTWCLNGTSNVLTGVTTECLSPYSMKVKSTAALATIATSDEFTTLIRISVGLHNATCPIKAVDFGVTPAFSSQAVWSSTNVQEFFVTGGGAATAQCTPPSSNCCNGCDVIMPDPGGPVMRPDDGLPREFALDQNYPNPFNPTTTISLDLPKASEWTITVFNITGQVVKTYSGYSGPGRVQVEFDGSQVASGVYLYRAEAGEFAATKKMILMK